MNGTDQNLFSLTVQLQTTVFQLPRNGVIQQLNIALRIDLPNCFVQRVVVPAGGCAVAGFQQDITPGQRRGPVRLIGRVQKAPRLTNNTSRKTVRIIKPRACRIIMTNQLTALVICGRVRAAIKQALNAVLIFKNFGGP
ncbi:hypothetical protein [Pseudomonas syringae]|uniref:hypothetical protein n=1 Tax=Pseudomonas syringae TaxID=317 RepID=UPI001F080414|nr:hypothetical protein [Pseudomonas syringae]